MGRKRIFVRFAGVLFFMLMALCFIPSSSAKADDGTVVMTVGEKKKLKTTLKDAVWGSTNKKVAKVSAKGKVTAKSPGKCYVTAVSDGGAAVFSITVSKKNETGQKLVIGQNGEYGDIFLWLFGHVFVPGETIDEFMKNLGSGFSLRFSPYVYYDPVDLASSNIFANSTSVYLIEESQQRVCAALTLMPAESAYLKDMTVSYIKLWDAQSGEDDIYYFSEEFRAANAPSYDNFEAELLEKLDDSFDYVRYVRNGTEYDVYITNDRFKADSGQYAKGARKLTKSPGWFDYNLLIRFVYDTATRECNSVEFVFK